MLHTTNPVIKHKTGLLHLADEGGVDELINRSRRAPNLKNRTDDTTEQAVVDYAVNGLVFGMIMSRVVQPRVPFTNWRHGR